MSKTGIGTAIAFSGGLSYTGRWLAVRGMQQMIEILDDTALASTNFKEYVASDLKDMPEIEIDLYWDYTATLPTIGTAGTLTITFPKQGATTAGSMQGSAIIANFQMPDLTTEDTQLIGTLTVKFDGKTEPSFTKAS